MKKTAGQRFGLSAKRRAALIPPVCAAVSLAVFAWVVCTAGERPANQILRPALSAGTSREELIAVRGSGEKRVLVLPVEARELGDSEAEELLRRAAESLPERIRGQNDTLEEIVHDLVLPERLEEWGVEIVWQSSRPEILGSDGHLSFARGEEAEEITLTASLSLQGHRREREITVTAAPALPLSWEERLLAELERLEERSAAEEVLTLPDEFEGEPVSFARREDISRKAGLALMPAAAGLVFFLEKGQKENRRRKKRREEISADYPELIVKMTVLYQAGLSMRGVWERIGADALRKGGGMRPIYEEVCFACNRMADGVPEPEAYRQFGLRCCTGSCLKLGNLLAGNVRRGTEKLAEMMAEESARAWEQRKHMARRSGEKAGTKMLLPMFMMFGVVLAIVVTPAFYSFMG